MDFFITIYFKEQLIRRGGLQTQLYNYTNVALKNAVRVEPMVETVEKVKIIGNRKKRLPYFTYKPQSQLSSSYFYLFLMQLFVPHDFFDSLVSCNF